jgi:hypothetical protein
MTENKNSLSSADIVEKKWRAILAMGPDLIDPEIPRTMYAIHASGNYFPASVTECCT